MDGRFSFFTVRYFYSHSLRIFLDGSKLIGKLFSFFKIELLEHSKLLIYNGHKLKLPKSYTVISNKIISISKKTSKIINKTTCKKFNKINLPYSKYLYTNNKFN